MNRKEMIFLAGLALAAWHALSIMKDAERCRYKPGTVQRCADLAELRETGRG